ncbi:MAG: hypothetical protein FJ296_11110, partial [Planctomycetes bacterium]|nr:hypothetical protein [Planctomycetota bacterium]
MHLAALGHPVVGDKLYGPTGGLFLRYSNRTLTPADHAALQLPRQALHSHALGFTHPTRGPLRVVSPWPADLDAFTGRLERELGAGACGQAVRHGCGR